MKLEHVTVSSEFTSKRIALLSPTGVKCSRKRARQVNATGVYPQSAWREVLCSIHSTGESETTLQRQ